MIKEFTDEKRVELNGKSRSLVFGKVGYRKSSRVIVPKALEAVLVNLRRKQMDKCISVKETINKDVLKTYPEEDILAVGCSLKTEDTFYYEIDENAVVAE